VRDVQQQRGDGGGWLYSGGRAARCHTSITGMDGDSSDLNVPFGVPELLRHGVLL